MILLEDTPAAIERALDPLFEYRQRQTGDLFHRLTYSPGESTRRFLGRHGVSPGLLDPRRLPYYLLLVGDPRSIPFDFQSGLSLKHAVGRLWFDGPEGYSRYARGLVEAERHVPTSTPGITFFVAENDQVTQRLARDLVEPLTSHLVKVCPDWEIEILRGKAASKARLGSVLNNASSSILFVTGHGVSFPPDHEHQRDWQGGLVCQDWPGHGAVRRRDHLFVAEDVPPNARIDGLMAFLLADFGGGTPAQESLPGRAPIPLASEPFIARLPVSLLGNGALAVVARLGRGSSPVLKHPEDFPGSPIERVFENVLVELLDGSPIGHALWPISNGVAAIAADLAQLLEKPGDSGGGTNEEQLAAVWTLYHDLRSFLLMGDPAARSPASLQATAE